MQSVWRAARTGRWAGLAGAALLAACGGNSGGDAPATPVPPASLTVSGTAATGDAIAGGSVDFVCATGSGSATTAADGTYSINIVGGALPCVGRVTGSGGTVLHTLATGSGATAVANLTSVTELVVASLASGDPAAYYTSFNSTVAATVSAAALTSAENAVVAFLKAAGIDLTSVGDLLSSALHAKTSSAAGDAYDQALDLLQADLASSGGTLSTLTTAVVAASPGTPAASTAVSLPASLMLKPQAANCQALRSTTYRVINPVSGATAESQIDLVTVDAATLVVTYTDGSTDQWTANGPCRYSLVNGTSSADITVSQAGVLLGRYTDDGISYANSIGFPEQTHAVAETAGNWNTIGMGVSGSTHIGVAGSGVFDATGKLSGVVNCQNASTWAIDVCANVPDSVTGAYAPLAVDAAGGFDLDDASTQAVDARFFMYEAGGGATMLATVSADGFGVWSKVANGVLPVVGAATVSWNFDLTAGLTSASALYETTSLIDAVDTTANSWTRTHGTVGQTVTRIETIFVDKPRAGYFFRPSGAVTGSDGTTVFNVREFTLLRLRGMGVSAGLLPQLKNFEFSATEP